MPLDLLIYERDSLRVSRFVTVTQDNSYFGHIRGIWGQQLRKVFNELPDPEWDSMPASESWPVFEQQIRTRDQ
jgi:putative proteasome-type protease